MQVKAIHGTPGSRALRGLGCLLLAALAGCATAPGGGPIYVPVDNKAPPATADETPSQPEPAPAPAPAPAPEEPEAAPEPPPQPEAPPEPRHRTEGQGLSPAAASLVRQADQAFQSGNISGGMGLLQRAQRISPDAAAVYYKMAEGYVLGGDLARAEQFALKGISQSGGSRGLQWAGWRLLSDIRRARGNVAGAQAAEERASSL